MVSFLKKIQLRRSWNLIVAACMSACSPAGEYQDVAIDSLPQATFSSEVTGESFRANWFPVQGARYYLLDVSLDVEFTTFLAGYSAKQVTSTSELVIGLDPSRPYFYRVRAANSVSTTDYSKVIPVRDVNRDMLFSKVWNFDSQRSGLHPTITYPDIMFHEFGVYEELDNGTVLRAAQWNWIELHAGQMENRMQVNSNPPPGFIITFVHIDADYIAAYVSAISDEVVFFKE